MNAHIIRNGVVENTIVVDSLAQAQAAFPGAIVIEATKGGPGWTYAGGEVFAPAVLAGPRHITRLAFRNRFLSQEKVALELASRAANTNGAAIKVYLDDVAAATFIDLDREDTRAGVQFLEAAGLIGAGRAAEILDAPILTNEAYRP